MSKYSFEELIKEIEFDPNRVILPFVWFCIITNQIDKLCDEEIFDRLFEFEKKIAKLHQIKNQSNDEEQLENISIDLAEINQILEQSTYITITKHPISPPSKEIMNHLKETVENYIDCLFPLFQDVMKNRFYLLNGKTFLYFIKPILKMQ